jgi:phosphatidylglycerophosphate synthase
MASATETRPRVASGAPARDRLAFKAREIEELADIYFFRPFGMVFALAARALGLTPTAVTIVGTIVGVTGGALLARTGTAMAGFALLILHGVLDSSDGQLARLTGTSSDFGRMMDGIGGYSTHAAIYGGVTASALHHGGGWVVWVLLPMAMLANVAHAQMYDYQRNTYIAIAVNGEPTRAMFGTPHRGLLGVYEMMERALAGRHPDVERVVAKRQMSGRVREDDRRRYRRCFYWTVRGWNLLGDNTRFYAIGILAWLGRVDAFLLFVLLPMNLAFLCLWLWQERADRRFLSAV